MNHTLINDVAEQLSSEPAVAVATLVSATGSSSKKVGAKMFVGSSGRLVGGVTIGGCVDAQVIEAADSLVEGGGRKLMSISLDDDQAWEIGLTCGGSVEVVIDRVSPNDPSDPLVRAHEAAREALARDEGAVIVTSLDGEFAAFVVTEDGVRHGTLGSAAVDSASELTAVSVLHTESGVHNIGGRRYFFERVAPAATLIIVGAGQIAMSLSVMGREVGMRTVIADGRDRYATAERFPSADEVRVGMPSEIVASYPAGARLAVVLVAHDYKYELPVLRHLLRTPVGYIGMLGNKTRGAAVREELTKEGFTSDELRRIHTPIGLDIGGRGAGEIALSILSEIVAVQNGKRE
ncbi:MAG: XdhC family protein [Gemmatimonadaceae bacterium]